MNPRHSLLNKLITNHSAVSALSSIVIFIDKIESCCPKLAEAGGRMGGGHMRGGQEGRGCLSLVVSDKGVFCFHFCSQLIPVLQVPMGYFQTKHFCNKNYKCGIATSTLFWLCLLTKRKKKKNT